MNNKENVVYRYNGVLFSQEQEGNTAICDNMDEPERHYAKCKKPDAERQILHAVNYMWNLKLSNS